MGNFIFCAVSLLRRALMAIYKAFITTNLDYGDILYDQAYNTSFH